ncbi:MAG: TIGR03621 family F420-dependent LLM class oxidoreductase [Actinomycetota bacterium]|nr:TIGR03621 family F420-dependent LLM class oxidoreductase [Actinomycetota bacterium]
MEAPHPFRFGLQVSKAESAGEWVTLARAVEAGGYDTLFIPDHLGDQLAPMPALTAAAMVTERLVVAPLVLDNDFRHPSMLAKEAATLHLLAGGRSELGLGAGWMTTDYDQSGIVYDRPGVRIDRMVEAIAICKAFFAAEGPVSHGGEHYRLTDLPAAPEAPGGGPKLLIGGGGPRVLGIAAREADIVGVNPILTAGHIGPEAMGDMMGDAIDRKIARVREAAGDRLADIELNLLVFGVVVGGDREEEAAKLAPLFGVEPAKILETPHVLVGNRRADHRGAAGDPRAVGLLLHRRPGRRTRAHGANRRRPGRDLSGAPEPCAVA